LDASSGWSGDGIVSDSAVNPTVVVNARGEGLIAWGDDEKMDGAQSGGTKTYTKSDVKRTLPSAARASLQV
jgi:hypothetical protein